MSDEPKSTTTTVATPTAGHVPPVGTVAPKPSASGSASKAVRSDDLTKKQKEEAFDRYVRLAQGTLDTVMSFDRFLSASARPRVRDAEVIVCFADIRGFTNYCRRLQEDSHDRKIQRFLQQYFAIFVEGLHLWRLYWERSKADGHIKPEVNVVKDLLVPSTFKNLGDGMMLVWEVPPDIPRLVQGQMPRDIVELVECISLRFYHHFRDLTDLEKDSFSEMVCDLDIGFALAQGHAWRLDFPHGVDYAGSVVNLTSRLLDFARPRGIVAPYLYSQALFDDEVKKGKGSLCKATGLKGFPGGVVIWTSPEVNTGQTGLTILKQPFRKPRQLTKSPKARHRGTRG